LMSMRGGAHVILRWIGGRPYDAADIDPLNRMPWRLMNLIFGKAIARELGPLPPSWPVPTQRPIEGIPIISSDLVPAVRRGDVVIKPGLERLRGGRASSWMGRGVDRPGHLCDRVLDQPSVHGPFAHTLCRPRVSVVSTNRSARFGRPLLRRLRRCAGSGSSPWSRSGRGDRRRAHRQPSLPVGGTDVAGHRPSRAPHQGALPEGERAKHPLQSARVLSTAAPGPAASEVAPVPGPG
jgi:hypothetical protein